MAFVFLDKRNVIIGSIILALIFTLGIIIGHFGRRQPEPSVSYAETLVNQIMEDQFLMEKELVKEALESVDTDRLRTFLKQLTKEPHIAGHRRDNELTKYIQKAQLCEKRL